MLNFSVLDQKKIQNLMREGGEIKKNIGHISTEVIEGDEIEKNF